MRTGYLDALAARTLGVAPLLRPVTPGRFEPDGPHGAFEALEIAELTVAEPAAQPTHRPDPRTEPPVAAPPPAADAPLLPPVQPDAPLLSPAPHAPTASDADAPGELTATRAHDTSPLPIVELARSVATEPSGSATAVAAVGIERDAPSRAAQHALDARRPDRDTGAAHPAPEVPVVIHIGRVEVRAAEPAPRAVLPPRAPVHAGRSLADHLLARDRELS